MADMGDPTGVTGLLIGLFTLAAAIGALRKPGLWRQMVQEIEDSPALQLLCGFAELATGAVVFLTNPWLPDDLLTCIMKSLGAMMMIEALAITAMSDLYFHFWLKNLAHLHRTWALATLVLGGALTLASGMRFG